MHTETTLSTHPESEAAKSLANYLLTAERIAMGVILIGCGVCGFLNLLSHSILPERALELGGSLLKAGFIYPFLKGLEVLLQVYVNRKA